MYRFAREHDSWGRCVNCSSSFVRLGAQFRSGLPGLKRRLVMRSIQLPPSPMFTKKDRLSVYILPGNVRTSLLQSLKALVEGLNDPLVVDAVEVGIGR
jgi:hypothetical protein